MNFFMAAKTKKQKITINDLALMIKNGFNEVNGKLNEYDGKFDEIKIELKEFKETNRLEHEEIKLRLDNVAYKFELAELQKRVEILEERAGIMPQNR